MRRIPTKKKGGVCAYIFFLIPKWVWRFNDSQKKKNPPLEGRVIRGSL